MALSIEELELESADYLPAREVMTTLGLKGGGHPDHGDHPAVGSGGLLGVLDVVLHDNQVQGIGGQVNDTLNGSFNDWTFLNGNTL